MMTEIKVENRNDAVTIQESGYTDYLLLFGDCRTIHTDSVVKSALRTGGVLYILRCGKKVCGYLCAEKESWGVRIGYAYTRPEVRGQGVFRRLMAYAAEELPRPVRLCISDRHSCFPYVQPVCRALGFTIYAKIQVFTGKSEDFFNWERYYQTTGEKLVRLLEKQGFHAVSFADAPDEIVEQIHFSAGGPFANELDAAPFFENPDRNMDWDMSFAAVREGAAEAYTLVSRPDSASAVFEHISVSRACRGTGVILLPFARSMELFREKGCRRAAYAMFETNRHANAFQKKLLPLVTSERKLSLTYQLK